MTGFEHYQQELAALDREIRHYAAVCGVSLENRGELETFLRRPHDDSIASRGRETLHGLLALRLQLETEMLELGVTAPPLVQSATD